MHSSVDECINILTYGKELIGLVLFTCMKNNMSVEQNEFSCCELFVIFVDNY
jgi:hypothetical protein